MWTLCVCVCVCVPAAGRSERCESLLWCSRSQISPAGVAASPAASRSSGSSSAGSVSPCQREPERERGGGLRERPVYLMQLPEKQICALNDSVCLILKWMLRNCSYRFLCLLEAVREEHSEFNSWIVHIHDISLASPQFYMQRWCNIGCCHSNTCYQSVHTRLSGAKCKTNCEQRELNELLGFHTELLWCNKQLLSYEFIIWATDHQKVLITVCERCDDFTSLV